ncbi:hypothetical protein THAOC_32298, partial [Thalassiosira oceanica]
MRSLFTFKKRERRAPRAGEGGGFTFADEVGGKDPVRGSPGRKAKTREGGSSNGSGLGSPSKVVEEGAKAYVDGTLFTDGGGKTAPTGGRRQDSGR